MAKHEKVCSDNQHAFMPFVFDTLGFLTPNAVDLLYRVQMVMHSNVMIVYKIYTQLFTSNFLYLFMWIKNVADNIIHSEAMVFKQLPGRMSSMSMILS
ncbi:hypothetical protein MtrunA17_Chr6g0487541 [Medicago truncatula]|uniref:Transmembrane protein, putative n=1 Tax=Medicago truncatula TaxID=3880 RepID=A0A072UDQ5_MEDTR|nr:transmembrane protein, putative [Medicago truncatula]RHN53082.1 hypothetical protein MtrunA17_Chr6g0487541 [Medicago truncatula]